MRTPIGAMLTDLVHSDEREDVIVEIRDEPVTELAQHGSISIAFEVDRLLEVLTPEGGIGGITLRERIVEHPYAKDYDAIKGEGPQRWLTRFDLKNCGLKAAYVDGKRVGGAVIAFDTPGIYLLDDRNDLAELWDLRVEPAMRGLGVGRSLFLAAEQWARERRCTQLQVETQNVNVSACHFYLRMGCELRGIDRFAYPDLPTEVRLLWLKYL